MATRKTWIWVFVGVGAAGVVALVTVAGVGVYFVSKHIQSQRGTTADAMQAFEAVRKEFPGQAPLYEVDANDHAHAVRPLHELPTSPQRPEALTLLAWDADDQRLLRMALPFWILRLGNAKVSTRNHAGGFDLEKLDLDVAELERVGPVLLLDYRHPEGARVVVWTH